MLQRGGARWLAVHRGTRTVEEEEVVLVGGEGDVLGLLGAQGGHDCCGKCGANVELWAGQGSGAQERAEVSYVVDLVGGNLQCVPATSRTVSVDAQHPLFGSSVDALSECALQSGHGVQRHVQ